MGIKFACACGKKFNALEKYAGRRTICPDCRREIDVPIPGAQPATVPPPLLATATAVAVRTGGQIPWPWLAAIAATAVGGSLVSLGVAWLAGWGPSKAVVPAVAIATASPRYIILQADGDRAKDVFSVRLAEKPDEATLRELSQEIRRKHSTGKDRAVIYVYLPEVDAFNGPFGPPWAIADFNGPTRGPGLEIEIYGLTIAQEAELLRRPPPPGASEVIGRWIEYVDGRHIYTIYHKAGSLFLEMASSPESKGILTELVERERKTPREFQRTEFSKAGDRYLINRSGALEMRDDHGLILVSRHVK